MSIRNLKYLFRPQSVALIGASLREHSVGATVMRNLINGGFSGSIYLVNPKYDRLDTYPVCRGIEDLPATPDLAVICSPPSTVPGIIAELGARGTRAAVVLTAGLNQGKDDQGRSLKQQMLDAAKPYLLRILGPNCVGMLVPSIGLNVSLTHTHALSGRIAFVTQSGALMTGVLDWARSRGIGFSKFVCLGNTADIDFGDMLDYLASDAETHAILLYVENIRAARKFMSAARTAARIKRIVVIRAGRALEHARSVFSFHTGALTGSDQAYDAAIRRAGMLRVFSTDQLFDAVETLARFQSSTGDRLAIFSNGGGPGVMAADALVDNRGRLARLSDDTVHRLAEVLPPVWTRGNPIDLLADAPVERYVKAMELLLRDEQVNAILCIHVPTPMVNSAEIARALVPIAKNTSRNIITCWLGGDAVRQARQIFAQAGIPTYDTPEEAIKSFIQILQYGRNQSLLMQVPASMPADYIPDRGKARSLVREALAAGRMLLSEPETQAILSAYGIPVAETRIAHSIEEAVHCAEEIGFPVAVKVLSPDITHKSDVGGVALDLDTAEAVRKSTIRMQKRMHELMQNARLSGFMVQAMARRPQAHELIVGVTTDPVFGPVILFGEGGIAVEVTADHAVSLPPLNMVLARDLISQTRVARLLAGYRNRPPADIEKICRILIQVSHLVTDIAEVVELDINPLLADDHGVIALDARMRIAPAPNATTGADRLAIRPYPEEWEEVITWRGTPLLIRPIKPEDAPQHIAFFNALDPDDVRKRAFTPIRELQPWQLARLTQIDYDREMAFIASRQKEGVGSETLGVARIIADPDGTSAEFAIIVRSDIKRYGLGSVLMAKLIEYCRHRGIQEIIGETLSSNRGLVNLVSRFGFEVSRSEEPGTLLLRLSLTPTAGEHDNLT